MTKEQYLLHEWELLELIENDDYTSEKYYETLALVEAGRKLYPQYTSN